MLVLLFKIFFLENIKGDINKKGLNRNVENLLCENFLG